MYVLLVEPIYFAVFFFFTFLLPHTGQSNVFGQETWCGCGSERQAGQ